MQELELRLWLTKEWTRYYKKYNITTKNHDRTKEGHRPRGKPRRWMYEGKKYEETRLSFGISRATGIVKK